MKFFYFPYSLKLFSSNFWCFSLFLVGFSSFFSPSFLLNAEEQEIHPKQWLVLKIPASRTRSYLRNSIEIQGKEWKTPEFGDTVSFLPTKLTSNWKIATPKEDGTLQHPDLKRGYAFTTIFAESEQIKILEVSWHSMAYFNGEPRGGDVYGKGYADFPVLLKPGKNELLIWAVRGKTKARLYTPKSSCMLNTEDLTFPDFVVGEAIDTWAALPVMNASKKSQRKLAFRVSGEGMETVTTPIPLISKLSSRKVGFQLKGKPFSQAGKVSVKIELVDNATNQILDSSFKEFKIKGVKKGIRETFRSQIDDSIQYYAVKRATSFKETNTLPAFVLSTHGASVEAINQANAYGTKSWAHLVAPTNRRPFGYNWEEWGRLDALEVMALAQKKYAYDPQRVYLTGHSMGGHGVWSIGSLYPSQFAALGPSAGWGTIWSYQGRNSLPEATTPFQKIMQRLMFPSDVFKMLPNTKNAGIYILQGAEDRNVPPQQPLLIIEALKKFHRDWNYHEEPGAKHWWGNNQKDQKDKGALCVDWPPMFDFFSRRSVPRSEMVRQIDFITPNPGISSTSHWLTIEAQIHQNEWSEAHFHRWPNRRRIRGTTQNVARITFDLSDFAPNSPLFVEIDGNTFAEISYPKSNSKIHFEKKDTGWELVDAFSKKDKGPHRSGPFKEALQQNMVFVYGTKGTSDENQWSFNKARYDAEQFWYRANSGVAVLSDEEFLEIYATKNKKFENTLVLYGNAQSNGIWKEYLSESPIQFEKNLLTCGKTQWQGEELGGLFIRPHPFSDHAYIVAIGGTSAEGMKLTNRLEYFSPFKRFPDYFLISAKFLENGNPKEAKSLGYFGIKWELDPKEQFQNPPKKE